MLAELDRLVSEAHRPDRRFQIRSEKYHGFYAGHLPDGEQMLVTCNRIGELRSFFFSGDGDYLGMRRRTPETLRPEGEVGLDLHVRQLHEILAAEYGFAPGLIRVKEFEEPEALVSVAPLPAYLEEFARDPKCEPEERWPALVEELKRWVLEGDFVLNTFNDYWLDSSGEVSSS
jgi:hypothetical protein